MRTISSTFAQMTASVPPEIRKEIDLEFVVSNRIDALMKKYGYTKLLLAQKLGKRPSEITKWLSGQHNFTLRTIAQLSAFFGEPLVWAVAAFFQSQSVCSIFLCNILLIKYLTFFQGTFYPKLTFFQGTLQIIH